MPNYLRTKDGEPMFYEGSEEYVMGMGCSMIIGLAVFMILSVVFDTYFPRCSPNGVLYAAFVIGIALILLGLGYAIPRGLAAGLTDGVKFALGFSVSGLVLFGLAAFFISAIEGRLYLLMVCR